MEFERTQYVQLIAPMDDIFNTSPTTFELTAKLYDDITFKLDIGAGGTGTGKVQVEACDNAAGDNAEAIPFKYKKATTGDTFGDVTDATAADGFTTTAGTGDQYVFGVHAKDLPQGKPCLRVKLTEVANDPVFGCLTAILTHCGHAFPNAMPTAIAA
jgi:hypothetical protein